MEGPLPYFHVLDLVATLLFAITGALTGIRKGYDAVGVAVIALVSGLGGGLLRDGLFLQQGPPAALLTWKYLAAVLVGVVIAWLVYRSAERGPLKSALSFYERVFLLVDALALGMYAVVGAQRAQALGLGTLAVLLVGGTNAVGGSVLRDVLTREEPLLFRPGQYYTLIALAGCGVYLGLLAVDVSRQTSAILAIAVAFTLRAVSVQLNWKTTPLG